jgi:hypothetical protein
MNRSVALVLLALAPLALAQAPQLHSGSTVFIEPMGGYETYLAAALLKKHVPLIVVYDKEKASYIIRSTISRTEPNQPAVVVNNNSQASHNTYIDAVLAAKAASIREGSIAVIDEHSSQMVFAYSARPRDLKGIAEDCAQHMKEFIEKGEKPKK